jgi:hypothetical protein
MEYNKMMSLLGGAMAASGQPIDLEGQIERALWGSASSEISEHLQRTKRTIEQEYELVQQKKSSLTRRQREYVQYLYSKTQRSQEGEEQ